MEQGKTYRFPYQGDVKDIRHKHNGPSQIVQEIFKDIDELTKGRNQISEKELIKLKKKYGIQ